ncbi:MAG: hypothetical protein GX434_15105 [Peptococcaceae bacterium]|nr:hypothetical protein [Peptococcaceae bacterium]
MIFVKNTEFNTGVAIYGDYMDFENLYDALHAVVGDEEEFVNYESARMRVLAVCYDLRHALMGDREIEFVDNGMDEEQKKRLAVLAPDKNVYLKIYVLWPEMLFVVMALNELLKLYAKKLAKTRYSMDLFIENKVIWDSSVVQVRMLQAAVADCLKETVPDNTFARMLNVMNGKYVFFDRYITQYIDLLNHRFIGMNSEKRLKNISSIAKRIAEQGQEYRDLEVQLRDEAGKRSCDINDLQLALDFPEEIEW